MHHFGKFGIPKIFLPLGAQPQSQPPRRPRQGNFSTQKQKSKMFKMMRKHRKMDFTHVIFADECRTML